MSYNKIKIFTCYESEVGHIEKEINEYLEDEDSHFLFEDIKQNTIITKGGSLKIFLTVILERRPYT